MIPNNNEVTIRDYWVIVKALNEDNDTWKELIDKIILGAIQCSNEPKKLLQIESGIYYIVNELYNSNKDYFIGSFDANNPIINKEHYLTLESFLKTLKDKECDGIF